MLHGRSRGCRHGLCFVELHVWECSARRGMLGPGLRDERSSPGWLAITSRASPCRTASRLSQRLPAFPVSRLGRRRQRLDLT
jgi:hypothetical protein